MAEAVIERLRRGSGRVSAPAPVHDQSRSEIRIPERYVLQLLGVADFLSLKTG